MQPTMAVIPCSKTGISEDHNVGESAIQAMRRANCKTCMELNGSPEEAKVVVISKTEELQKFRLETCGNRE